jgi:hypothetical protein
MKFAVLVAAMFFLIPMTQAQEPEIKAPKAVIATSTFFCKVDEFSSKKAVAKAFKRCDRLVEATDQPTKTGETCKDHALAKGRECLKLSGAEKISVKVKFIEKFGGNQNISVWTCELDNKGGSACP